MASPCCGNYKTTYIGGDTMIDFSNITYGENTNRKIFKMFVNAITKRKERKPKEPKGKAEDGSYCPKKKAGQSWSYTKDRVEKENDREDVA